MSASRLPRQQAQFLSCFSVGLSVQAGYLPHSILRCSYFLSIPLTFAFLHRISSVFSALYSPGAPAWGTARGELPESRAWCVFPGQTVIRRHRPGSLQGLSLSCRAAQALGVRGTPPPISAEQVGKTEFSLQGLMSPAPLFRGTQRTVLMPPPWLICAFIN